MKNLLFIKILLLLLLRISHGQAQDGDFFLTHYAPGGGGVDNINFDIIQDHRGVICIANRSGIITFDGMNWDFFKTPSAVFSLSLDENNTIYTGGRGGFGKLIRTAGLELNYVSLSDRVHDAYDIFSTLIHDGKFYAINKDHIFIYDIAKAVTIKVTPRYSGALTNLTAFENEVYVTTAKSGLKLIEGSKIMSPRHQALQGLEPEFIAPGPDGKEYLIGTHDKLYIFKDKRLTTLELTHDHHYIQQSEVKNGIWLSDSLAALSTLKGGVIFIDPSNDSLKQVVNYQTGLPDNEVFAMAIDQHSGVWAAHALGLTRISPAFPFRNYSRYPGLEGKMLSVKNHEGTLYVGTSLGAYYLDEVRDYNEIVRYVKVPRQIKTVSQHKTALQNVEEGKKSGGGIFGFLRRGRKAKEDKIDNAIPDERANETKDVYKPKIEKELRSVRSVYKKIPGIDSKTFSFSSADGRLFCGGMDGLFEIKGSKAIAINRSPIRYFYVSEKQGKIFANTYDDELKVFDLAGFDEVNIFGDYKDYVQYIFEDSQQRIWFCSTNDLYWVKVEGNQIIEMDEHQIKNPYYYETYGTTKNDSIFFINESGIYTIDEPDNALVKIQSVIGIDRYLPGANGQIWLHSAQKWSTLVSQDHSGKLDLLGLFKNINYISVDSKDDYWIITDNNNLYKLSLGAAATMPMGYELYLKDIKTNSQVISPSQRLRFDHQNSGLIFEFVQPEYSGVLDIQYQYKLAGLNDAWSEWSADHNVIDFPYLPEGEYTLLVKSRDALGTINVAGPVSFEIVPPFWKRPWFYAFEFSTLALLLFVSVSLKRMGYKYRLMSRLLALLVLIIVIEFIQTVAENEVSTLSSPVIDFVIQVIVAIIILPVEGGLRKYILKDRDVKLLDFIEIKNKSSINPKIND
ncbi:MAG: triple tyrosine motif-containing protein [Fulvivirga sp.]